MAQTHVDKRRINCRLGNRKPTEKQRALIKAVIQTIGSKKKIMEAAKEAGYASKRGTYQALKSPTVQKWVARSFKKLGLDDLTIITPIKEALKAVKYDKQGNEIPDWDVRLKAVDMQIKLMGSYPAEKIDLHNKGQIIQRVVIQRFAPPQEIGEDVVPECIEVKPVSQLEDKLNRTSETQPQIENKTPANGPFKS